MATYTPPRSLDFLQPSTWPAWKQSFVRFATISKLKEEDKDVQVSTFIYCMGIEAEDVFAAFTWDHEDDQKDPDKVMKCFDRYFIPRHKKLGLYASNDGTLTHLPAMWSV